MARIVGAFGEESSVQDVIEQLQLNGVTAITPLTAATIGGNGKEAEDRLRGYAIPDELLGEYQRRLQQGQQLLLVQVAATELPLVQRAFRAAPALDIDLLPEPGM